ncbi:MAG: hypothetical protein QOF02_2584 [Blastocatellia bacterium]|jgi:hypothetical protein|nr:hypothetical protein [Blastocatellia bacterium]
MHYRTRLSLSALLLCALAFASVPARSLPQPEVKPAAAPFEPTEELVYDGEFTRSLLRGINVAELRFTVTRAPAAAASAAAQDNKPSTPALRFTLEAFTKGILRKLFGLNFHQRIESTVEPASFSVLQTNKIDEQGKRQRISEAVFDRQAGKVVWTERDPNDPNRPPRVVTNQLSGAVQDIASAFYFLRTQPLALGQSFEMLVSDSGQIYRTPVRVTERKKMSTTLGQVWTLRVEPEIFGEGHLLRGKGKMSIWFTDDARRVPVKAQINNELGRLDIKLKSARKLSAPLAL